MTKEERKVYMNAYRLANAEKIRAYQKSYRDANHENRKAWLSKVKETLPLIVKDEVERLAEESVSEVREGNADFYFKEVYKEFFIEGYKAREQKGVYSEDDLRNAFNAGERYGKQVSIKGNIDEYIQSLKEQGLP